jgi:phage terminase large subunit GpA-like protein
VLATTTDAAGARDPGERDLGGDEPIWSDAERLAWSPPEKIDPPRWAEKYRWLTRRQSTKTGFWRNENAPYLVGIMLMCVRLGIEVLTILKASQIGVSEAMRCVIGFWAHLEPDPLLLVLPDKEAGKTIVRDRLMPLFEDTPVLDELSTGRRWDMKNNEIVLSNGFTLRLGYSGSITSVAAHPARRVICDERSKFQDDGKVSIADSIAARTSTYEESVVVNLSTPGADPDPTEEAFRSSQIKLYYFVTCPHCGTVQRLTFDRLQWEPKKEQEPDKNKRAAIVVANRSAWMECENPACAGRITDEHKRRLINDGFWATPDLAWKLFNDGHEEGTFPIGTHVGMHAPAFISLAPKHRFYKIAERFIRAEGDVAALTGVYNELFAEVFREQVAPTKTSTFAAKCLLDLERGFVPSRAKIVPRWASRLVMTVDTQKDHFYFVIRAWGPNFRSRRIHHGKVSSFDELDELFYRTFWPYEDEAYPAIGASHCGIDSGGGKMGLDGSRTDAVYRWCNRDPVRLFALKGDSEPKDSVLRTRRVVYQPPDQKRSPYVVFLHLIDSGHFNDLLASSIETKVPVVNPATGEVTDQEVDQWELNDFNDDDYNRQMANVHKVRLRKRGKPVERWIEKTAGARHDYRDCEKYQQAMAHGPANCVGLPSAEAIAQQRKLEQLAAERAPQPMTDPHGRPYLATRR